MHSNLKSLESKYIDLANFYKNELVQNRSRPMKKPKLKGKGPIDEQQSSGFDEETEKSMI